MLGDSGRSERAAGRYLPYVGHIGPQTCLLESGAVMAMAHVEGTPFELADHTARNARLRLLNTLYRNLADDNVTIYTHLIGDCAVLDGRGQNVASSNSCLTSNQRRTGQSAGSS